MRKRSWSLRPGNFEANRRIKLSTWTSLITIFCLLSKLWNPARLFTVVSASFLSHLFLQDSKESVHLFMRKSLVDANDCSGKLGITPGESKNATYIGPSLYFCIFWGLTSAFEGFRNVCRGRNVATCSASDPHQQGHTIHTTRFLYRPPRNVMRTDFHLFSVLAKVALFHRLNVQLHHLSFQCRHHNVL